MSTLHHRLPGVAIAIAPMFMAAPAQAAYELSSQFIEVDVGVDRSWKGHHDFEQVFCLDFPRPADARTLAFALFNDNTLYFSRLMYHDLTALYVVSSVVPAGISPEAEISKLQAQHIQGMDLPPRQFEQRRRKGVLGPSLILTLRNTREGGKDNPFPFARPMDPRPDAPTSSLSVHRIFVHGRNRIELAGLRYFRTPLELKDEDQAKAELAAFVERAADSLQSCTARLVPAKQTADR